MAKRKTKRPEPPPELLREIEWARRDVKHHEDNGQFATCVHQKLARLEKALAEYLEVSNGTSIK